MTIRWYLHDIEIVNGKRGPEYFPWREAQAFGLFAVDEVNAHLLLDALPSAFFPRNPR